MGVLLKTQNENNQFRACWQEINRAVSFVPPRCTSSVPAGSDLVLRTVRSTSLLPWLPLNKPRCPRASVEVIFDLVVLGWTCQQTFSAAPWTVSIFTKSHLFAPKIWCFFTIRASAHVAGRQKCTNYSSIRKKRRILSRTGHPDKFYLLFCLYGPLVAFLSFSHSPLDTSFPQAFVTAHTRLFPSRGTVLTFLSSLIVAGWKQGQQRPLLSPLPCETISCACLALQKGKQHCKYKWV